MTEVLAVDPPGCGCTGCVTGVYVPLDQATPGQVAAAARGVLGNNTGFGRAELAARSLPRETASRPRAFVYAARGPATDGEWRWFPAVRWFAPDGRCVRTMVLGAYGATWDAAAARAWNAVKMERLRSNFAQQPRPSR